jgi:rfaE bifunctional protein nucleotidyltransferase chain/domain
MPKLLSLAEFLPRRAELRRAGKKLVCTNGCFDIMHAGHIQSLTWARGCGDALIVLLNGDDSIRALNKAPERPLVGEKDRATMLTSLAAVDFVIVFDTPRCDEILAAVAPDIYVKSSDYTHDTLPQSEVAAVEKGGGEIRFAPLIGGLSTTALVEKIRRGDPDRITLGAFSFVRNGAEEILLVRNRYDSGIRWGLPGGTVQRGENLAETATREAREETGLIIATREYVGLIERINPTIHLHCHLFRADITGGELRIDPNEEHVIDAGFFSAPQIPKIAEPVRGREYILRYATAPETYPRYVRMGLEEE